MNVILQGARRSSKVVAALCSVLLTASAAPASEPRRHDGFYLRVASGFGAFDERLAAQSGAGLEPSRGRSRGIATLGELALGGTLGEHWVVGGGIYAADVLASTYRADPERPLPPPAELDPGLRSLSLIGPFFDWYARSSGGVHLQAALGLATLTPRVFGDPATEQSEYLALGGGLMLGAGYDFWIADEWSLGVLSRTTIAFLRGEDDADRGWTHLALTSPGLLVTLTYH